MKNLIYFSLVYILAMPGLYAQAPVDTGFCLPGHPFIDPFGLTIDIQNTMECLNISDKLKAQCECLDKKKYTLMSVMREQGEIQKQQSSVGKNRKIIFENLIETYSQVSLYENYQRVRLGLPQRETKDCGGQALEKIIRDVIQTNPMVKEAREKNPQMPSPEEGILSYLQESKVKRSWVGEKFSSQSLSALLDRNSKEKALELTGATKIEKNCITMKEYYGLRSIPSNGALSELENWNGKIQDLKTGELTTFIAYNPIISKLISSEDGNAEAVKLLKNFAHTNSSKDPSQYTKSFNDLLKDKFVPMLDKLHDKNKSPDILMCMDIGVKLVASQIYDYYGDLETQGSDLSRRCVSLKLMGNDNLEATLNSNALYKIVSDEKNADLAENQTYQSYVDKTCQGYDSYKDNLIKIACSKKDCSRMSKDDLNARDEAIRQQFLISKHTQNKDLDVVMTLNKIGLGGDFERGTADNFARAASKSSLSDKFKASYNEMKEMLADLPIIAKTGQEDKFIQQQNQKMSSLGEERPNTPSNLMTPSFDQQSPSVAQTENIVSPNWINEAAPVMPSISAANIAQANQAMLPKDYETLSAKDKVKAIDEAEKNLNKFVSENPSEVKTLEKQLQEMREELSEAKKVADKEAASDEKKIASKNENDDRGDVLSPSYRPSQVSQAASFGGAAQFSTGGASSFAAPVNMGNSAPKSTSATSRDDALLSTKYASEMKELNRNPASVDGLTLQVSGDAINSLPNDLGKPQTLTVTDGQLSEIKSSSMALNKVLQTRIKELGLTQGQNKLVELKSSDSDKKMYLQAIWKGNTWVFHPFNRSVQEQISRTHTLKSLSETLQ